MRRKIARFMHDLSHACRRVGNEYNEAGTFRGERDFRVSVVMRGLERPESSELFEALVKHQRIKDFDRYKDDELARGKLFRLDVTILGSSSPVAATTLVLDVLRAALFASGHAEKVERLTAGAVEAADA